LKTIIISAHNFFSVASMMVVFFILASSQFVAQDKDSTSSKPDSSQTKVDSTGSRKLSFDGYPYAYYTPETELAVGVGGIFIFYGSDILIAKPSQIIIGGYYTTNDQYSISINPEMYFFSNDLYISAPLSYGYNVTRFYGIGPSTPDTGKVDYTSKVISGTLTILGPSLWLTADKAGIVIDYNYTEIVDKEDNQYLLNNEVLGSNGGDYAGIGLKAVWDTRNNIFYPTDGKYSSLKFMSYPVGEFIYYTTELDVKSYATIMKKHVLAGEVYFSNAVGNVPFYALPQLGGQYKMRGYYQGRYADNAYFTVQLELRQYFWGRLGYVVFGSVGTVAASPDKYQMKEMKFSYGAGLRFLFNEKEGVNLRMDIGITREGETGVYFGIGEAF
jgi:outer membrane protein assembly factor BamA